jgi:cytochrome c-type biogenesis protein CcmF
MAIVPLSVWGASTVKGLGKTLWKPAAVSLLIPLVLFLFGLRSWEGILGFWLGGSALCILGFDLLRTVGARSHALHEPFLAACFRLIVGNHRRYGGYLVHLGIVLMALGIIGMEFFQVQTQVTLNKGTPVSFKQFSLQFEGLNTLTLANSNEITEAQIVVNQSDGKFFTLSPQVENYPKLSQSVTIPAVRSTLAGDVYIVLVDWQPFSTSSATFRVYYNPLVAWLWIGAVVLILGGLFAFWPANPKAVSEQKP